MAGGGEALGGGAKQKRGKSSKRKSKGRLGFRMDMTPLVDITFLLLTFFMLTTSMVKPQTMEMNVPPEIDVPIEVRESELLTIRVREDGKVFYHTATDEPQLAKSMKDLMKVVVDQNVEQKNRTIVTLKTAPNAPYGRTIQVLDMLNQAEPLIVDGLKRAGVNERQRKFTVSPYLAKDAEELSGL
jgi:biopolymer transport protein ExbD